MCGIAGFCGQTSDNQMQIKRMCDKMIYRGPNAEGYWLDSEGAITLGHRRLSILDLSSNGSQPMCSSSGRFIISYNGEIYNFKIIRSKLINDGFINHFRSASDTEVILEAFEAYGLDAVKDMKGMFAIALYDRKEKTLHLMRDRMGEKPLYYGMVSGKFAFASDLSCLTVLEGFNTEINRTALSAFIRYKSIPQPLTIYKHIYKLLPGQILSINAPFTTPTFSTYWSVKDTALYGFEHPFKGTEADAKAELKSLLVEAVRGQMISDVPIGAFLSGGIDSPLVVSIMQSLCNESVKTFTIGFEEPKYNEAEYAKDISRHLGTNHTELYISEQDLKNVIPLLPSIYSEPLADPACLPAYLISKLAKSEVTVTLSGDGGDELFCGYELYVRLEDLWNKFNKVPYSIRKPMGVLLQHSPLKYNNKLYNIGEYAQLTDYNRLHELFRNEHNYDAHNAVCDITNPHDYLSGSWLDEDKELLPDIEQFRRDMFLEFPDIKSSMLYRDQTGFLPDTVLPKVDHAGMYVSLENRIPLLDKDIIEFSWTLPINYKCSGGSNKKILKELLYEYVPKEMLNRPKHGFEVPLPEWLSMGELHEWTGELILHSRLADDGYFNKKILHRMWKNFNINHSNALQIWYVLQAESWYRFNVKP
ncbi:MAG: asparagine synthase (glutamine-hydrolyzing) [Butyrivibrio sp.]|nr:asparagine synthase (glutamine-hydrolyzing) [Butyrivibrio sp.]